jgi:ribonuclease R
LKSVQKKIIKMSKKNTKNTYYEELKQEILAFFSINGEHTFELNHLHQHYDLRDKQKKMLYNMLVEELVQEGRLFQVAKNKFTVKAEAGAVIGVLDHVNPRFGYVRYDDEKPDIWVNSENLNGAIDGDTVKVALYGKFYKKGDHPEGRVLSIEKRGRVEIVGKISTFGNYALVKPDHKNLYDEIFIARDRINGASKNDLVIVKIIDYPTTIVQASGEVVEILGKSGDNNAEMHAIMAEFGLPFKFQKELEEEANMISEVISPEEIAKRRDFREILTFTIDPHDAKDFDDALSFRVLENGNYEVGVHIADVTHYVREGTNLENEAQSRATSVYLVDRTIPMLPEKLSNNLCSLRPNEDKLTFAAVFEINQDAKIINEWFGRTIIHSDKRFTYESAQNIIIQNSDEENEVIEKYENPLITLNNLAKKLRKERFQKGAINFETNEVRFKLDENGKPLGVFVKVRFDAHKLIEEFMLLANKRVAEFVFNLENSEKGRKEKGKKDKEIAEDKSIENRNSLIVNPTMVYRVHEPPDPTKLKTFAKFAGKLGFYIKTENEKVLSNSMNALMEEVEGKPMQNVLEQLAVRTMSKAKYTTEPIGHFGLAFEHYSHFTSPIRRYPDMMAHRMLQHYLDGGKSLSKEEFEKLCKHSSDREKLAAEAERASIKYKQVEFMSLQDNRKVYDGVVTGVTDFGIFVEIAETSCEGMVRLADLKDDYYELDSENYRIVGNRSGKIITFGDAVQVRVKATDLERRSMDLELIVGGQTHSKSKVYAGNRRAKGNQDNVKTSSRQGNRGRDPKSRRRRK